MTSHGSTYILSSYMCIRVREGAHHVQEVPYEGDIGYCKIL